MFVSRSLLLGIIVNLETDSAIFGAQKLLFGRPGASILSPASWGTMGAAGRTRRSLESDFRRFRDDCGTPF